MIQKGIIAQVIDKYNYKVRIPKYDKVESATYSTKTDDLSSGIVCTVPGIEVVYVEGDIVLLSFENGELSKPVILGLLYREEKKDSDILVNGVDNSLSEIKEDIDKLNSQSLYTHLKYSDDNGITFTSLFSSQNYESIVGGEVVCQPYFDDDSTIGIEIDKDTKAISWSILDENNQDITDEIEIETIIFDSNKNIIKRYRSRENRLITINNSSQIDGDLYLTYRIFTSKAYLDTLHIRLSSDKEPFGVRVGDYVGLYLSFDSAPSTTPADYSWFPIASGAAIDAEINRKIAALTVEMNELLNEFKEEVDENFVTIFYRDVDWTQAQVDTYCQPGYEGTWERDPISGYMEEVKTGNTLYISVHNIGESSSSTSDDSYGQLQIRATADAAAGQDVEGSVIAYIVSGEIALDALARFKSSLLQPGDETLIYGGHITTGRISDESGKNFIQLSTEERAPAGQIEFKNQDTWANSNQGLQWDSSQGQLNIKGNINASSLTIMSGDSFYDGAAAINISGYDIEIVKDSRDVQEGVSVYLYPVLYHNGEKVADYAQSTDTSVDSSKTYYTRSGSAGSYVYTEVIDPNPSGNPSQIPYYEKQIDYSHFLWYQDDSEIGTAGDANNRGRYLATYEHSYRVTYEFDDGAVGGGTEVQTRYVDPEKYITKVNDTEITVHPESYQNVSSYIRLGTSGLNIYNSSGNSIAQYGSTARIGLNDSSRFLMNSNSLEAYDNNNNKYFEVNSSGLSWGNNTAVTTTQMDSAINDAKQIKTNSVSGSIATFTGSEYPAIDVVADINPIQDLHGYNAPWVGGAGKNLLDGRTATSSTVNDVVWTVNSDGTIEANGTATADSQRYISINVPAGDYYFSGCPSGGATTSKYNVYIWDNTTNARAKKWDGSTQVSSDTGASADNQVQILSGHNYTFNCRVMNGYNAQNIVFKPMIRKSTETDGTWQPYENICPISGTNSVSVYDTQKNLFGGEYYTYFPLPLPQGTKVTVSVKHTSDAKIIGYYDENKVRIGYWTLSSTSADGTRDYKSFTLNGDASFFRFYSNLCEDMQIELGETLTDYEPFGNTYTTALGRTVYGGTLDVVSGELTVTHTFFNVTNAMLTNAAYVSAASNASSYYYNLAGVITNNRAPSTFTLDMGALGDKLEARQGLYSDKTVEGFITNGSYVSIRVNSNRVSDTSGASLASYLTSLNIVYPLATPQTYQLTPQQIELLQGTNNVWATTGNVDVKYAVISADAVEALSNPIDRASKVATNYITYIDSTDGIKVHDAADSTSYAKVNSSGLEVVESSTSVAKFGATSRIGELSNKTPHIEMNNRFMEINNNEKSYFGAGFVNQSASLIRIPYEAKYCEGTTTKTITTNCTISSINEIRGFTEFFKVIPLVPNLTYTFTPGTNTITLMNLDNYAIDTDFEFEIDYNTAQFSSLHGNYAPILNEYNTFFGTTYYPEHPIAGIIAARVDGEETPQLTYTLNQDGSITFNGIGTNDSHYAYISYVTSDALFAITSEDQTGAVGVNSVSFGKSNTVSGGYSAAIGKGLTTVSNNQVAIGKYNRCQSDSLFMVGNGDEPYDIEICLYLTSASNHPKLLIDMSKVTDSIQGGGCYFTTSDQYKWFFTIPNWYDENDPIVDISHEPFRVDDVSVDFITHAAVDSIEVVAITVSQHADQGEHNIYLNSDVNTVPATNTPTMIYATFAPVERNPFEVKTNGDTYVQGNLFAGGDEFNSPINITEPEKITLTFSQCTTGSYTRCYRLGQIVIISFNINVTTSTTNYDYITGLPPALEGGWAGSSGLPAAGMLRWWVTTDGTLRSDGAPTAGWHNGNIVYLCDKYLL